MKRLMIASGGSLEASYLREEYKKLGEPDLVACDKGYEAVYAAGLTPDMLIGDMDSLSKELYDEFRARFPERIKRFPSQKDETDTELALRYAAEEGYREVFLLGATGSRMDHFLGTLGLFSYADKRGIELYILDPYNRIRCIHQDTRLRKADQYGTVVSLIPFTDTVFHVTLRGFRYLLNDATMTRGKTIGVSNVIEEEEAEIMLGEGKLLVIEAKEEGNDTASRK